MLIACSFCVESWTVSALLVLGEYVLLLPYLKQTLFINFLLHHELFLLSLVKCKIYKGRSQPIG